MKPPAIPTLPLVNRRGVDFCTHVDKLKAMMAYRGGPSSDVKRRLHHYLSLPSNKMVKNLAQMRDKGVVLA